MTPDSQRAERYAESAFQAELAELANTQSGRNAALNKCAFKVGQMVGAGWFGEEEAYDRLLEACEANGYARKDGRGAVHDTIRSGLRRGVESPREAPRDSQGNVQRLQPERATLARFSRTKKLPIEVLRRYGWRDTPQGIEIPYLHRDGTPARTRVRTAMSGGSRFRWAGGNANIIAYEPDRGELARTVGYLVIVEGESDVLTLLHAGFPALGVPGGDLTKTIQAHHLDGIVRVFVMCELDATGAPDSGARKFIPRVCERLLALGFKGEVNHE